MFLVWLDSYKLSYFLLPFLYGFVFLTAAFVNFIVYSAPVDFAPLAEGLESESISLLLSSYYYIYSGLTL